MNKLINTSSLSRWARAVVLVMTTTLLTGACSDETAVDNLSADSQTTANPELTLLRFCVDDTATRLTYDGVSTSFEDDEAVGCVIATLTTDDDGNASYTYQANSKWTFSSSYGTLTPVSISTYTQSTDDSGSTTLTATTSSDLSYSTYYEDGSLKSSYSTETVPLLVVDDEGYIGVNSTDALYFFFYYPYIDYPYTSTDDDGNTTNTYNLPTATYTDSSTSTTYSYFPIMGVPYSETLTYVESSDSSESSGRSNGGESASAEEGGSDSSDEGTGTTTTTVTGGTIAADFTAFPIFVHTDQSKQANHNASDFLWASYTDGVSSTNNGQGTQNLAFEKKTTTIRIRSIAPLYNIKIAPTSSSDSSSSSSLVIGQKIDLTTGELTAYSDTDSSTEESTTTDIHQQSYLLSDYTLTPYTSIASSDEAIYEYRFVLPPQSTPSATLSFSYDEAGTTTYTKSVALTDLSSTTTLSEGSLYTVKVKKKTITAYFSSSSIVASESGYFSCTDNIKDRTSYQPTIDGTSYPYALNFDGSYVGRLTIILPQKMLVTFYFGKSEARAKIRVYENEYSESGSYTDYGSTSDGTVSNASAIEDYSIDNTADIGTYLSMYMNAGTYVICKASSGSQYVHYVVLEY